MRKRLNLKKLKTVIKWNKIQILYILEENLNLSIIERFFTFTFPFYYELK